MGWRIPFLCSAVVGGAWVGWVLVDILIIVVFGFAWPVLMVLEILGLMMLMLMLARRRYMYENRSVRMAVIVIRIDLLLEDWFIPFKNAL